MHSMINNAGNTAKHARAQRPQVGSQRLVRAGGGASPLSLA